MARHLPTVAWHTHLDWKRPYQAVRTHDENTLIISIMPGNRADGVGFKISRKDARLLARRIEQCLKGTLSK